MNRIYVDFTPEFSFFNRKEIKPVSRTIFSAIQQSSPLLFAMLIASVTD
jgi:hypothetical protein